MSTSFIENSEINQASPTILVHHQIKGARWGVHRGPPYPLKNGIRTSIKRKEKAATKREQGKTVKHPSKPKTDGAANKKGKYAININDPIASLSNEELQARIDRFKKIEDYTKYTSQIKNGGKFLVKMEKKFKQINAANKELYTFAKQANDWLILFGLVEEKKGKKKDKDKDKD